MCVTKGKIGCCTRIKLTIFMPPMGFFLHSPQVQVTYSSFIITQHKRTIDKMIHSHFTQGLRARSDASTDCRVLLSMRLT